MPNKRRRHLENAAEATGGGAESAQRVRPAVLHLQTIRLSVERSGRAPRVLMYRTRWFALQAHSERTRGVSVTRDMRREATRCNIRRGNPHPNASVQPTTQRSPPEFGSGSEISQITPPECRRCPGTSTWGLMVRPDGFRRRKIPWPPPTPCRRRRRGCLAPTPTS